MLIQLSLISIISGLIYGLALLQQAHSFRFSIVLKTTILSSFMFYLLNLTQLLLILIAILLFLITFWITILKLER